MLRCRWRERRLCSAGFEVIGYDIAPQPNYPYEFWQGDVFDMLKDRALIETVDAIHLSVPCQRFTAYRRKGHGVGTATPT
jgi:DNA (cytosine-5)-methyltransferase 1